MRQAAQILANEPQHTGAQVRKRYLAFIKQMQQQQADLGPLGESIAHFCQITKNFTPGFFQCYDIADLPCTNNELEQCSGVARVHERRATGRLGAIPGVVVRGSVRVVAAVTNKQHLFSVEELQPRDYLQWRKQVACAVSTAGGIPPTAVPLSQRSRAVSGRSGNSAAHLKIAIQRKKRRGSKWAALAIGHNILVIYYQMMKTGEEYQEKGEAFFPQQDQRKVEHRLTQRLERMG